MTKKDNNNWMTGVVYPKAKMTRGMAVKYVNNKYAHIWKAKWENTGGNGLNFWLGMHMKIKKKGLHETGFHVILCLF